MNINEYVMGKILKNQSYNDPRVNYDGMEYQIPGPKGDLDNRVALSDNARNADTVQLRIDHPYQADLLNKLNIPKYNQDILLRNWNEEEIDANPQKYGPMLKDGRRAMDYLSFNPTVEDIRSRIFKETPDQQNQRLNQKVIDYMRFKMQNPNFLFNDYIDNEIKDIDRYKRDRLIT